MQYSKVHINMNNYICSFYRSEMQGHLEKGKIYWAPPQVAGAFHFIQGTVSHEIKMDLQVFLLDRA